MLFLTLLACSDPAPVKGPDDDVPVETGGWEAPELDCELTHPLPITEVPGQADVAGPAFGAVFAFPLYYVTNYTDAWGCPTETGDETALTWEGDCVMDGFSWQGRLTNTMTGDPETSGSMAVEAEGVRLLDERMYELTVALDGSASMDHYPDGTTMTERDFTVEVHGYQDWTDGAWIVDSFEYSDRNSYSYEARIDAVSDSGLVGDYCVIEERTAVEGCTEEPYGGWVLQGDATLIVAFDPDISCDGCGRATLDGVDIGEVCGSEYGTSYP